MPYALCEDRSKRRSKKKSGGPSQLDGTNVLNAQVKKSANSAFEIARSFFTAVWIVLSRLDAQFLLSVLRDSGRRASTYVLLSILHLLCCFVLHLIWCLLLLDDSLSR